MKRIFSTTVLTICSVFSLNQTANAACSPVDCAALGYTKTEAACEEKKILRCPFDATKVNCLDKTCNVGDIYYSDGTCDDNVIAGKTAVGVVGYITDGGKHGGVISFEEKSLKWGPQDDLSCLPNIVSTDGAPADMNGKSNTQCIMSQRGSFPAAEYCDSYKPVSSGKGSTGWYLPSAGELRSFSYSYGAINLGSSKLSKTQLSSSYYWSSSEYYNNGSYAWIMRPSDGYLGATDKNSSNYRVRCVLEF